MKQIVGYKNGHLLSYVEYGDPNGYPILIQHGLIASIDDCSLFDRLLSLGALLISIARPGYGESSPYVMNNLAEWADIVSVLVDKLQLAQFDVLGMSSGAPYSYAIGYKCPDKVRNIYIFSGIPALYDTEVLSHWPYEVNKEASLSDLQTLAHTLFFSNLSTRDLENKDIKDSMRNNCFGLAQDFKLRCIDWGFRLNHVTANVYMRHSRLDESVPVVTACLTAKLLPYCQLEIKETGEHFSKEELDDFIETTIAAHYVDKKQEYAR